MDWPCGRCPSRLGKERWAGGLIESGERQAKLRHTHPNGTVSRKLMITLAAMARLRLRTNILSQGVPLGLSRCPLGLSRCDSDEECGWEPIGRSARAVAI